LTAQVLTIPANVANFVRQDVRIPKSRPLLPIFEAISNSLDAIIDRGGAGTIDVTVIRESNELDGVRGVPHTFIIEDDGIGFNDENLQAFDLLYSERKLSRGGKGRGRFTYLKAFEEVRIESTFQANDSTKSRQFSFGLKEMSRPEPSKGHGRIGTKLVLARMRSEYANLVPRETAALAKEIISHFLPVLLSKRPVEIVLHDGENVPLADLVRRELVIQQLSVHPGTA
jgi:hypothetical protein